MNVSTKFIVNPMNGLYKHLQKQYNVLRSNANERCISNITPDTKMQLYTYM